MKILKTISLTLIAVLFVFTVFETLKAYSTGITGRTKRPGSDPGCTCHGPTPSSAVTVTINGPSSVEAGDTTTYTLTVTGGPLSAAGCNISAKTGQVITSSSDPGLQRLQAPASNFELTHVTPKTPSAGTVTFTFRYIAPNSPGTTDTLFANGNSVNLNSGSSGDQWNFAPNKPIAIVNPSGIVNRNETVSGYELGQNYPNPFNPVTRINFSIPKSGFVKLSVFDLSGKEVSVLVNENLQSGTYEYEFDAKTLNLSSGAYFYKIQTGDFSQIKKMILTK